MKREMQQKFGDVDMDELRMKLDGVKHELRQKVQLCFDQLDKLFKKRKIKDVEQRRKFLAHLQPKFRKLCMVRTYANVKEMLLVAKEMERMLGELGETPFEPLKEEQEESMHNDTMLEKQVNAFNESFINFFKGSSFVVVVSPLRTINFTMCQICKASDHIVITCPCIGDLKPKCVKCGLP